MKLIFIGTADFATPSLKAVSSEHEVKVVVTQPDRPGERGMRSRFSPVKKAARKLNLPIYQPENINSEKSLAKIDQLELDGFVLAAYGQIISAKLLDLVKWPINIHGSLLPKYRGAAPINWAIINGEKVTGITTIIMDEGVDTGPILLKRQTKIDKNETAQELHDRLADLATDVIIDTLAGLQEGTITPEKQRGTPTYAPKLTKEDGLIDWNLPSFKLHDYIRGTNPWPGAYSFFRDDQVGILRSKDLGRIDDELAESFPSPEDSLDSPPGEIIDTKNIGLVVRCGDGTAVRLIEIQPPSKSAMSGIDFVNGYHLELGEQFTNPD